MSKHKHAEVIKAWADGETIQWYDSISESWIDYDIEEWAGPWSDVTCNWRIKPKSVTLWVNVYPANREWCVHDTRADADERANKHRIACVPLTYTIGEGL